MNKLTIPAILAATVMVAGIFAFMPVEQASTVHTTLNLAQASVSGEDAVGTGGTFDIVADSNTVKDGAVCVAITQETTNGGNEALTVEINQAGDETIILDADLNDEENQCFDFTGYRVFIDNLVEATTIFDFAATFAQN